MTEETKLLDDLMRHPRIKNLGLTRNSIESMISTYHEVYLERLLQYGIADLGNGMTIEVVPLVDRVHVLRGIPYKSKRKYKLKLDMEDKVYDSISSYYDKLKGDIS